jgi:hypothetical protein
MASVLDALATKEKSVEKTAVILAAVVIGVVEVQPLDNRVHVQLAIHARLLQLRPINASYVRRDIHVPHQDTLQTLDIVQIQTRSTVILIQVQ